MVILYGGGKMLNPDTRFTKWDWVLLLLATVAVIGAFLFNCGFAYALHIDHNWKGETEYSDDGGNLLVTNAHTGNCPSDIKSRWFLPNGREVVPKGVYDWDGELINVKWEYTGSRREAR
jgi:hypothetical protein